MKNIKILTLSIILFGILFGGAKAVNRKGIITFKGKLRCVGAESDKFLKYAVDKNDPRGFQLTVNRYQNEGSTFTIEYTKLFCATGEDITQELFGNKGCYYVGNIITPDNKYLIYDFVDNQRLMTTNKIPKPDYANYTWLIFHCIQLDQYMFWPLFQQPMFLQKFRLPDVIDVILFQKSGTDGAGYVYWKFMKD